jgi:urease accessory protein
MHEIRTVDDGTVDDAPLTVTLSFDERRHTRARVRLDDGSYAGLLLPRGTTLVDGTRLRRDDGRVVVVRAAPETLSSVESKDPLALLRAAYHLGNRHVALELAPGRVRYQHDHVLDDLVRTLGLAVDVVEAPFQPEPGAYARDGHGHAHGAHDHHHHAHP